MSGPSSGSALVTTTEGFWCEGWTGGDGSSTNSMEMVVDREHVSFVQINMFEYETYYKDHFYMQVWPGLSRHRCTGFVICHYAGCLNWSHTFLCHWLEGSLFLSFFHAIVHLFLTVVFAIFKKGLNPNRCLVGRNIDHCTSFTVIVPFSISSSCVYASLHYFPACGCHRTTSLGGGGGGGLLTVIWVFFCQRLKSFFACKQDHTNYCGSGHYPWSSRCVNEVGRTLLKWTSCASDS